jgi:hypothetical protein
MSKYICPCQGPNRGRPVLTSSLYRLSYYSWLLLIVRMKWLCFQGANVNVLRTGTEILSSSCSHVPTTIVPRLCRMTSSSFHDCDVNVSLSNNLFTFVSVHNTRHINRDTRFLLYRQMMCVSAAQADGNNQANSSFGNDPVFFSFWR